MSPMNRTSRKDFQVPSSKSKRWKREMNIRRGTSPSAISDLNWPYAGLGWTPYGQASSGFATKKKKKKSASHNWIVFCVFFFGDLLWAASRVPNSSLPAGFNVLHPVSVFRARSYPESLIILSTVGLGQFRV